MTYHRAAGREPVPCFAPGRCRVCELIDRDGPDYQESYRRLFHPEEFGDDPVPATAPDPEPLPSLPPGLPLAGDLVAGLTGLLGVDGAVKYVADSLGVDCGCPERREKLNRLDATVRKFLGIGQD